MASAMSHPESGYVLRLERTNAQPHFVGDALVLQRPEGADWVELIAADQVRFRCLLLPVSQPMRE